MYFYKYFYYPYTQKKNKSIFMEKMTNDESMKFFQKWPNKKHVFLQNMTKIKMLLLKVSKKKDDDDENKTIEGC